MIDTHELAWAAGFFDGEGCTSKYKRKDRRFGRSQIGINQTDRHALNRFQNAVFGLGRITGPNSQPARVLGKLPFWSYQVTKFKHVQAVISALWKYLGPVKRAQAIDAMRFYLTEARKVRSVQWQKAQTTRNSKRLTTEKATSTVYP